ncbi:hypothetical protein [Bosea sp. 685]|uniref:hypothetical protein n=1 Tax=Bosea sp. 685 TaxID=3080057 RepID=UPI002893113B|nr:hypothetical protein [Bosea sp. 685]WNJ91114.1 hypothetical protein RMR04_02060 [Bosea sp. 685]
MQNPAEGTHPCLISYGITHLSDLPLVLVVGREPNGTSPVSDAWGPYDFYKRVVGNRRAGSPFWDGAYGVMGTATAPSIDTKGFKALVAARGVSPLIFADALPHGIDNAVRNKVSQRLAIPTAYLEAHIRRVFSHEVFINRVKAVLLSGFTASLERSARAFEAECHHRGIPFQHLPFFAGQNLSKIRETISAETWAILRSVAVGLAAYPMSATTSGGAGPGSC